MQKFAVGETRTARIGALVSAVFLAVVIATAAGLIAPLVPDGHIDVGLAVRSLVLYWALSQAAIFGLAWWTRKRKQLQAATVLLAVVFIGLEVTLRVLAPAAARPELADLFSAENHHVYPKNRRMSQSFRDKRSIVDTNEDGLRSPYSRESFRRRTHRIITVGDSSTFGFLVPQQEALPARLEDSLRSGPARLDVAVLNAAVGDYSPFLEKLQFDRELRYYDPTLVMLFLDADDIADDHEYLSKSEQIENTTRFQPQDRWSPGYYGAVIQVLREPLAYPFTKLKGLLGIAEATVERYPFQVRIGGEMDHSRFFIYRHPLSLTEPYFESTLSNISAIAASVRSAGAEFILVVVPRFHHWNPAECPDNWDLESYGLSEPYQYEYFRFFEDRRERVDFPILNLLSSFQESDRFPLVFSFDRHWNREGHSLAAETVAQYLLQEGFFEAPRGR